MMGVWWSWGLYLTLTGGLQLSLNGPPCVSSGDGARQQSHQDQEKQTGFYPHSSKDQHPDSCTQISCKQAWHLAMLCKPEERLSEWREIKSFRENQLSPVWHIKKKSRLLLQDLTDLCEDHWPTQWVPPVELGICSERGKSRLAAGRHSCLKQHLIFRTDEFLINKMQSRSC